MKRTFSIIALTGLFALCCATLCTAQHTKDVKKEEKKLVVYFSRTGENYNVGVIEKGNTHIIADMIANATSADRFEIVPTKRYPENYDDCVAQAKKELHLDARPAVKGDIAIEDYDIIFVGYPNWCGEIPMCVYTFIGKHNWKGKTVIPFVTHEGSGIGSTARNLSEVCAGANVLVSRGLAVQGKVAQTNKAMAQQSVLQWLKELGL